MHPVCSALPERVYVLVQLGRQTNEWVSQKVVDVLEAARCILSGAGVDNAYSSNLTQLYTQHGQHERYSARRYALLACAGACSCVFVRVCV